MHSFALRLLCWMAIGLGFAMPWQAKTLRWAARGDAQSMDPHAVNEGVTNNTNNLVHDALVERSWQQTLGVQRVRSCLWVQRVRSCLLPKLGLTEDASRHHCALGV